MTSQPRAVNMAFYNQGRVDPSDLETFIEFNQSPVLDKGKGRLRQPRAPSAVTSPTSTILPLDMNDDPQRPLQPSHDYSQYKQQTGLPTRADHLQMLGNSQIVFPNYNTGINESQLLDGMGVSNSFELNSPSDFNFESFLENDLLDSHAFFKQEEAQAQVRFYPGMHQQQAEQQRLMRQRQLQIEAEQEKRAQAARRSASHQPLDQRTEETISRVMSEIRRSSHIAAESVSPSNNAALLPHIVKAKKDDDMDEDERLLNSEEGKKLSSKERRQLRNKVSARAFRSRRKEYISQLESEVAAKVNEASELKRLNHALMQENARYKVLAEKLLAHPAFHPFLEELSRDPALAETLSSVSNSSIAVQPSRQMPKDVDPFAAAQQFTPPSNSETQVGMTLIPEMPVDLSALNIGGNNWALPSSRPPMGQFMPQVFAVTEVPETPAESIDFSVLSGKGNDDVLSQFVEEEKTSFPEIEAPAKKEALIEDRSTQVESTEPENQVDENDETMTLFAPSSSSKNVSEPVDTHDNLFGDIAPEKAFAHFELFVSSEQDNQLLMDHFERMCARLDARCNRLEAMISGF